jgi:Flp pilus assembly protein TadB
MDLYRYAPLYGLAIGFITTAFGIVGWAALFAIVVAGFCIACGVKVIRTRQRSELERQEKRPA